MEVDTPADDSNYFLNPKVDVEFIFFVIFVQKCIKKNWTMCLLSATRAEDPGILAACKGINVGTNLLSFSLFHGSGASAA